LINFFTPVRIYRANPLKDLGGAAVPTSDRLSNKKPLLPHVQNGRFMGSGMQGEDAACLHCEQLLATNRTPWQYQLDWKGTFLQLFAQG
jgi:hypothetical protein